MAAALDLTKAIDKLVEEKTFTLDAVGAIKDLRDLAAGLETRLADALVKISDRDKAISAHCANIEQMKAELTAWSGREAALKTREGTVAELEKKTAVAEATATTAKEFFHAIFRNTVTRETVNRDVPLTRSYGGNSGDTIERHQSREVVEREQT